MEASKSSILDIQINENFALTTFHSSEWEYPGNCGHNAYYLHRPGVPRRDQYTASILPEVSMAKKRYVGHIARVT